MNKEAMKMALEALKNTTPTGFNMESDKKFFAAIKALEEALAQPEQEPVAVVEEVSHDGYLFKQVVWKVQPHSFDYGTKFYTTPPQPNVDADDISAERVDKTDKNVHEHEPVAITITGKLGKIYSFTGDYSLKKGDKVYTTPQRCSNCASKDAEPVYGSPQPKQEQGEPVAYGMCDTMIGKGNRMMYVRLDKGQDGCTVPLYDHAQQRKPLTDEEFTTAIEVEGIPVEDVELVWAIKDLVEVAHGIKAA